ncbi:hypothetical protein CEW83_07615 [Parazoarcus communis]|uniref:Bacteriophage T5 Orf172 DNA-binding domain-containing protein n=1 Tax=Parazoarcus communis TaxID=41977 RepID=A0A2U8GN94_9RHOO|nr:GIY-YIG nuclease family protein [Parazoarcus communis]AWI75101.1 hypothetical protein CEW83_07615 [Parazoarcus communis]
MVLLKDWIGGREGWVYISRIQGVESLSDVYKVGMTKHDTPEKRIRSLSTAGLPGHHELVRAWPALEARSIEWNLHKVLKAYAWKKEFFKGIELDRLIELCDHEITVANEIIRGLFYEES